MLLIQEKSNSDEQKQKLELRLKNLFTTLIKELENEKYNLADLGIKLNLINGLKSIFNNFAHIFDEAETRLLLEIEKNEKKVNKSFKYFKITSFVSL